VADDAGPVLDTLIHRRDRSRPLINGIHRSFVAAAPGACPAVAPIGDRTVRRAAFG
jgi:hypothetical protein